MNLARLNDALATARSSGRRAGSFVAVAVAVFFAGSSCNAPVNTTPDTGRSLGDAVCREGSVRSSAAVEPKLASLQPASRAPRRAAGSILIVQSGSNTIGRYDLETGNYSANFIDVGSGRNPYGLAVDASTERAWITNLLDDSVSIADISTGEVVEEFENREFDRPSAVALAEDHAYVASTRFENGASFEKGRIALVDRKSRDLVDSIDTTWKNPQHARRIETPRGPRIAMVSAGAITQSGEAESPAGLEIWEPDDSLDPNRREAYRLGVDRDEELGALGRPLPSPGGRYLYFTSATAPVLFKFDVVNREWVRGIENPIQLYETDAKSLNRGAIDGDGVIYVAAFNRDALYGFDTTCDEPLFGPVELGIAPNRLEGPNGLVPVPNGRRTDLYFAMSVGNRLGRVRLRGSVN